MTPKTRYIIPHNKEIKREELSAIVYVDESKLIAQGYSGKRGKRDFLLRFSNITSLLNYIDNYFNGLKSNQAWKKEQKESRLARVACEALETKIGDILYNSWGYEQTNVDFYQVIDKKGKKLLIRKIAAHIIEGEGLSPMAGYAEPIKDKFLNDYAPAWILAGKYRKTEPDKKHYVSWYA